MTPTTHAAGLTCGHRDSTLVRTEGLGGVTPIEVWACATPGCPVTYATDPLRDDEACGFAPEHRDDGWW